MFAFFRRKNLAVGYGGSFGEGESQRMADFFEHFTAGFRRKRYHFFEQGDGVEVFRFGRETVNGAAPFIQRTEVETDVAQVVRQGGDYGGFRRTELYCFREKYLLGCSFPVVDMRKVFIVEDAHVRTVLVNQY